MKRSATVALVVLISIAMFIPQTLAITSQGFFYRVEDGDRFYFTMELNDEDNVLPTEIIYFEVENASIPIPDPVTHLSNFSYVDWAINFENGTSLGIMAILFLYMPQPDYPVGNWALISTLAETDLEEMLDPNARDLTMSYSDDLWGFSHTTNDSVDTEILVSINYSKFDGLIHNYNIQKWNTTSLELIVQFDVDRFSDHNLSWGFNDGDRFDFNLTMTGDELAFHELDEDFYIEVADDGLFVIPYLMDEFDDIPYLGADLYWANDTESYDPFLSHAWRLAMPIGNWSLLGDLVEGMDPAINATLDDPDPLYWGYSRESTSVGVLRQIHTDYLKADGFLAHYSAIFTNTTTSEIIGTITVERVGLDDPTIGVGFLDLIMDNILYIGIGAVVLLGVAVCMRKRS